MSASVLSGSWGWGDMPRPSGVPGWILRALTARDTPHPARYASVARHAQPHTHITLSAPLRSFVVTGRHAAWCRARRYISLALLRDVPCMGRFHFLSLEKAVPRLCSREKKGKKTNLKPRTVACEYFVRANTEHICSCEHRTYLFVRTLALHVSNMMCSQSVRQALRSQRPGLHQPPHSPSLIIQGRLCPARTYGPAAIDPGTDGCARSRSRKWTSMSTITCSSPPGAAKALPRHTHWKLQDNKESVFQWLTIVTITTVHHHCPPPLSTTVHHHHHHHQHHVHHIHHTLPPPIGRWCCSCPPG